MQQLAADPVVGVVQPAVLDVEGVAAGGGSLAEQDALGARLGDLDVGGDAVRAVEHPRPGEERDRLRVRVVDERVPRRGDQRFLDRHARDAAAVDGHHVVLAGLDVPGRDQRDQPVAVLGGEVVVLGGVLGDVVELPALRVELGELLGGDRLAEPLAGLGERRPRPRAHRPPAVVVDRAVAHHLEVLRRAPAVGRRIVEGVREAHAVQR